MNDIHFETFCKAIPKEQMLSSFFIFIFFIPLKKKIGIHTQGFIFHVTWEIDRVPVNSSFVIRYSLFCVYL